MRIKKWEIILFAVLALVVGACTLLEVQAKDLSGDLIRLRVVANSDSPEDQRQKLLVRDRVLETAESLMEGSRSREDAERRLAAGLEEIRKAAVQAAGEDCSVRVYLEDELYDTRDYEGFSLPAGTYRSLRVELGEAAGQNWWCCVFPPLCTASSMGQLEQTAEAAGFRQGQIALITEQDGYTLKFKALEFWQWLKNVLN